MTHALALAAGAAVALAVAARPAHAQDGRVERQTMKFVEQGSSLYVTGNVTSVFDASAYERLENGLPSTVVVRLWIYPERKPRPAGFVLLHRQCVYDLWGETYACAVNGPTGRRTYKVKFRAEALKLLTALDQVPIADVADVAVEERYVLAAIAELNPVSKETLAEVRRWLSDGRGGGLDRGGSFFGSFVSVFVNLKIPEADRVVRIRSQPFYRPRPAPPPRAP
ncbi:MAG: hypothetical protein HS111_13075 [Kofleriaceae bacterium]|nr:hypothetical protein [Kofleriaceae bacterium]MCL4226619.1 hypothetical protein [Myxococcales bacterium]